MNKLEDAPELKAAFEKAFQDFPFLCVPKSYRITCQHFFIAGYEAAIAERAKFDEENSLIIKDLCNNHEVKQLMFFTIRFKSADGLLQQDFNPKEFKQAFGFEFNGDQDTVRSSLIEVFIPKSGYPNDVNIFNRPAQYRVYRRQETIIEPIVIYNEVGREITAHKTVVCYQEIIAS